MLNEDIRIAQQIITGSYNPLQKESFHSKSFMYKASNENIRAYQKFLENKRSIFSITASGDQILNSILLGTKKVIACDISRFPNYFLALKIGAILSLSLDEYINFFIDTDENKKEFSYDYYIKFRDNLNINHKKFWDSLFNFFSGDEIYKSLLFSHEVVNKKIVQERNLFLEEDQYNKLRKNLYYADINYYCQDLSTLSLPSNKVYDLVNLSSIIYYGKLNNPLVYQKLLNAFMLTPNGQIITYLYKASSHFKKEFTTKNFTFHQFETSEEGIMVYQKK